MKYVGNPKHKEPWQRGKKGSLCGDIKGGQAQKMLDESELVGERRYAVLDGRAFCAHRHGSDQWHGHPVGWVEVPEDLRKRWRNEGKVSRRDIHRHWN